MKAGPKPEPRIKMLKLDILIAFALLVVVIIFSVWYSHHKTVPANNSSTPAGWTHYASNKYGFQFDYPGSWGKPQVTQDKGVSGSHYSVTFSNPKSADKRSLSITLAMDTDDYQRKVCPDGQCTVISTAITSKTVSRDLKANPSAFLGHDSSSYGFITIAQTGSTLQEEQIVSIPALKVSAAIAVYSISNASGCPQDKFAGASQPLCINQRDYSTVNEVLKSIKAV